MPEHIDLARFLYASSQPTPRLAKAAEIIIGFIQARGCGWEPFEDSDIQQYYRRLTKEKKRFHYRKILVSKGYLNIQGNKIMVTHELVAMCFSLCPNLPGASRD